MSDAPQSAETPKPPPPAVPPGEQTIPPTPAPEPKASPPAASAKGGGSAPIIEYAMPEHKSWLPSPAFIRNLGCLMKVCVALTVVLGMGYFALVALNPKARQWATQGAKDGSGGPTPFKSLNQVLAIPAQAMGKTDDVVKANNARVGQLDNLVAEEEAKASGKGSPRTSRPVVDPFASPAAPAAGKKNAAAPEATDGSAAAVSSAAILALAEKRTAAAGPAPEIAPPAPRPSVAGPAAPDTPAEMKLPGGIVISQASSEGTPRASAAFFFWVVNLNVSGITQGKPARALLNRNLAYEGDVVNKPLGVVFVQIDSANKVLVFRDQAGATVTRSY